MAATTDNRPVLERGRLVVGVAAVSAAAAWGLRLSAGVSPLGAAWVYLALMSLFAFALFGIDKYRAARHARRVSESNLLWTAAAGGALGAIAGMLWFRHKSQRWKFRILLSAFAIAQLALALMVSRPAPG